MLNKKRGGVGILYLSLDIFVGLRSGIDWDRGVIAGLVELE